MAVYVADYRRRANRSILLKRQKILLCYFSKYDNFPFMAKPKAVPTNPIRRLRESQNLTLQETAGEAGLSITRLHRLENGKRKLLADELLPLSKALQCEPLDLIETASSSRKIAAKNKQSRRGFRRPMDLVWPNIGPFRDEEAARRALLDRLICALSPEAIYLIGSRAEGRHRPDSDFDFVVVFPDAMGEDAYDYGRAYAPVMGLGVACDVVPCLVRDFEHDIHEPDTLARACVTTGSLQYLRHGATLPWLASDARP